MVYWQYFNLPEANVNLKMKTSLIATPSFSGTYQSLSSGSTLYQPEWAVTLWEAHMIHLVDLQLAVEHLKDLLNVWDVARLELWPQRNICQSENKRFLNNTFTTLTSSSTNERCPIPAQLTIQSDLKGSSRQKVSLHHVAEEVRHQTGENLPNNHWKHFFRYKF